MSEFRVLRLFPSLELSQQAVYNCFSKSALLGDFCVEVNTERLKDSVLLKVREEQRKRCQVSAVSDLLLAIVELALDDDGTGPYDWVKHIYIDDPISSLDEHNAIAVANHLAKLLKRPESRLKTVISTHHTLFFNVLCNELNKANKYFLSRDGSPEGLLLRETGNTPFFHHVAALAELYELERDGRLYTHHFNMLRAILEKTASFHGYENFSACIKTNSSLAALRSRLMRH